MDAFFNSQYSIFGLYHTLEIAGDNLEFVDRVNNFVKYFTCKLNLRKRRFFLEHENSRDLYFDANLAWIRV